MIDFPLPLLGFAAYSGTGKTTLLSKLIPLLTIKGLHIGVIKHAHHNIDIDHPNKDSFVLRESGAEKIVVASLKRTAIIIEHPQQTEEPTLKDALKHMHSKDLDLILVEGFKHAELPKIELHRKALNKPYIYPGDPNIIAIAVDFEHGLELDDSDVKGKHTKDILPTRLDLNRPQQIADYIEHEILTKKRILG